MTATPIDHFKNFIYTQYFSDGVKITLGVLLPSLIFFQYDLLEIGITLSLGALCVSIADTPGPWLHRKNGMIYTNLFIFLTSLLISFINTNPYLLSIAIFLLFFLFSMFYVYGTRAASVGTAALLILVLSVLPHKSPLNILENAAVILAGGIWYFLLSALFSRLRPYRYAQQTLGECITEIAQYMRLRSNFYNDQIPVEENYKNLINQQIKVHELQDNVREALFKTRKLMNESTNAGRLMIQIFVDMVDLFEQTMATHNDYNTIRERFGNLGILPEFAAVIEKMADEMEYIGFCIIHQEKPKKHTISITTLDDLKSKLDEIEKNGTSTLVLKKILINIRNIFKRTGEVYNYLSKETTELNNSSNQAEFSRFINHQSFDWKIFKNNLNFESSVFKYSLRIATVCLIGFLIGKLFELGGHSYWIMLTILVIMKPGFSNTQQRNVERLIGTIVGGIMGGLILMFIHDETAKFFIMLVFMLITYSFNRLKYVVSVIFMTPFILIFFSFINTANNAAAIAGERIIDTLIGSFLAFVFSYLLFPDWESKQFRPFLHKMLKANLSYLEHIILRQSLLPVSVTDYRLARKEVYVNTANLAAAFERMIHEPKSKQHKIKEVHKFVVLNHILSSYLANLSASFSENQVSINSDQLKLIRKSRFYLEEAIEKIDPNQTGSTQTKLHIHLSEPKSDAHITEQLELITKVSAELSKISEKL